MAARKKEHKTDAKTKPGVQTTSTVTQIQTTSAAQDANSNTTPPANLPAITPMVKLPQSKGDVPKKTPGKKVVIIESKEHFQNILKDAGDQFVMVEFFATWCNPCKLIGLKLEEFAELYKDRVVIVKIDVDNLEELAIEHDVTNMPAFMIMKNNAKVEQFSGSKVELIETAFEKYLGKPKE